MSFTRGKVFESKRYWAPYGSVAPGAATWPDTSRYGSDGAITTATWVQLPSGLWALNFIAATPDYVTIAANQTQLNFTSEDFSMVWRMRIDSLAADFIFYTRGAFQADGVYILYENTGDFMVVTNQAGAGNYQLSRTSLGGIVINTWYTMGLSRVGASIRLYINGVDDTDIVGVHVDPLTCARAALIGINNGLVNDPFDGQIATLAIYNYALSADEHNREYASDNYLLS